MLLERLLAERDCLIADGAMGTALFARGLDPQVAPETWLIERPDDVRAVHRGFVEAGADVILTNTFGANEARLARSDLAERMADLNGVAVGLARDAAASTERPVVVAGSVGPMGQMIGAADFTTEAATAMFAAQMRALVAAGADVIWIETMYAAADCRAAVAAAIGVGAPYAVTCSFGGNGCTVDGVRAAALARELAAAARPPLAIGVNCGEGPDQTIEIVREMAAAVPHAVLIAKANKGLPQTVDGRLVYPAHDMGNYARRVREAGARIIGGCCGTTADDIAAIRVALGA